MVMMSDNYAVKIKTGLSYSLDGNLFSTDMRFALRQFVAIGNGISAEWLADCGIFEQVCITV